MLNFLKRLTPAVLFLFGLNVLIYLLQYVLFDGSSMEGENQLVAYCHVSSGFEIYQLITYMFTHINNPIHLGGNMLYLLIFGPYFERENGFTRTIFVYLFFGFLSYLAFDLGINAEDFFILGSSGAVIGFCMYYLINNIFRLKKIVFNLLVILLIIDLVTLFIGDADHSITALGHLGGVIGGVIASLGFRNSRNYFHLRIQNLKTNLSEENNL